MIAAIIAILSHPLTHQVIGALIHVAALAFRSHAEASPAAKEAIRTRRASAAARSHMAGSKYAEANAVNQYTDNDLLAVGRTYAGWSTFTKADKARHARIYEDRVGVPFMGH